MINLFNDYPFLLKLSVFNSVEWKVQSSLDDSLLIYEDRSEFPNIDKFQERISEKKYKLCIVNFKVSHSNVVCISPEDWNYVLEFICDYFFPRVFDMQSVAITGTNGKTTCCDIIRQLLILKGKPVLTIGTLGVYKNSKKVEDFNLTTPNYIDFRKTLYKYGEEKVYVITEFSSHAIVQNRYKNFSFDMGLWTSFTQDHLDYHQTMSEYFSAKAKIQKYIKNKNNLFVLENHNHIFEKLEFFTKASSFTEKLSNSFLNVEFNRDNLGLCLAVLSHYGLSYTSSEIEMLTATPGRMNVIEDQNRSVFIDFAHTPDALENVIKALKPLGEVVVVFGCGGDRDTSKRSLMGEVAYKLADKIVITEDNNRFEDFDSIAKDILRLIPQEQKVIPSRAKAIEWALENYSDHNILIAGKGHEEYIDSQGTKKPYSDYESVKSWLDAKYK